MAPSATINSIILYQQMSGFHSVDQGSAASVYLALYTFFFAFMIYVVIRKGFLTVYSFLFMFTLFRFFGQLCGVVYAKLGPSHWKWLIPYLVLGAEGYFALIFAAFRFTCVAQKEQFGHSWILDSGPKWVPFPFKRLCKTWRHLFHYVLIPANAFVIAGGSMLTGVDYDDLQSQHGKILTSKVLRTVGQAIFLSLTFMLIALNIYVFTKERIRNHVTIAVMLAGPFLIVRGVFGVLSIYITKMNYFDLENYNDNGSLNHQLVIFEYVLSTTMEFVAALFLISKYYFDLKKKAQSILSVDEEESTVEKR